MARFQAITTPILDQELDRLREEMGLRENQKAELLRELVAIAAWVVDQAAAGRTVQAVGDDGVEPLRHPVAMPRGQPQRIVLRAEEADRLEEILNTPPSEEWVAEMKRILAREFPKPQWRRASAK